MNLFGHSQTGKSDRKKEYPFLRVSDMKPMSFLKAVTTKEASSRQMDFLTIMDDFPKHWIKKTDIFKLGALLKSKEKCKCVVNPLSSYLPVNDSADLGGYAIMLLTAYKENKQISFLWLCPTANEKKANQLLTWLTTQR